jgi:hypothetical protein
LFYVPHILCVYSLSPVSVHIGACGHRTVVFAHCTHHIHVLLRDTVDKNRVRLLWRSLYCTLYCNNLSRIEVWTARGRIVHGMCQIKEKVALREKWREMIMWCVSLCIQISEVCCL